MALLTQDQGASLSTKNFPTKGLTQSETQVALLTQDKEMSLSMALLTQIGGTRVALLTQGQGTTATMAHLTQAELHSPTGSTLTKRPGDLVETEGHDEEQVEVCVKRQRTSGRIRCQCNYCPHQQATPSPPTKSLGFGGFDSSRLLILRGGNSHVRRIL